MRAGTFPADWHLGNQHHAGRHAEVRRSEGAALEDAGAVDGVVDAVGSIFMRPAGNVASSRESFPKLNVI